MAVHNQVPHELLLEFVELELVLDEMLVDDELGKYLLRFHFGPIVWHPEAPLSTLPGHWSGSSSPASFAGPFQHCTSL